MSLNFSRQTFFAVFVPLTLVAGLFWLSEIRGYEARMSLLVLPKTEFAKGAADNLAALSRELPFAVAVYESETTLANPLLGKTVAEKSALWRETVTVATSGKSDLIRLSVSGADQDEALTLLEAVASELVRTASRYYNQKTDIDIRVIEEPATIPSFSEWPRFLFLAFGTALFFTVIFFLVYTLIDRLFPKKPKAGTGEYTISPETFKPRVPTYWQQGESAPIEPAFSSSAISAAAERLAEETVVRDEYDERTEEPQEPEASAEPEEFEESPVEEIIEEPLTAALEPAEVDTLPVAEGVLTETPSSPEIFEVPETVAAPDEPVRYVEHAAAPDNLPVFDGPLSPLQGAQARLLKLDIDATAEALAADASIEEIDHTPKTHEPTPEDYKRRLNDLLSGKM